MAKRFTLESRVRLEILLSLPIFLGIILVKLFQTLPNIAQLLLVNISILWLEIRVRGFTYDNYEAHKAYSKSLKAISDVEIL